MAPQGSHFSTPFFECRYMRLCKGAGSIWLKMLGSNGVKMLGSRKHGREKTKEFRSMANLAREQTKYDLGSREQRGHFTTGAGSMGLPLQSLIYRSTVPQAKMSLFSLFLSH